MTRRSRMLLTTVISIMAASIVAAPLALVAVTRPDTTAEWEKIGNIGDAFGAVSAFFSAIAFIALAISIGYQVLTVKQQRFQATREQHREFLRLLMDDPDTYRAAFDGRRASLSPLELRRDVFAQLIVLHYEQGYQNGLFTADELQSEDGAARLFQTTSGRTYWEAYGNLWKNSARPDVRRFGRVIETAYRRALIEEPVLADPEPFESTAPIEPRPAPSCDARILVGIPVAIVLGWLARSWLRR